MEHQEKSAFISCDRCSENAGSGLVNTFLEETVQKLWRKIWKQYRKSGRKFYSMLRTDRSGSESKTAQCCLEKSSGRVGNGGGDLEKDIPDASI